jgi:hypothetical protein
MYGAASRIAPNQIPGEHCAPGITICVNKYYGAWPSQCKPQAGGGDTWRIGSGRK